jgi:hypothetical protein
MESIMDPFTSIISDSRNSCTFFSRKSYLNSNRFHGFESQDVAIAETKRRLARFGSTAYSNDNEEAVLFNLLNPKHTRNPPKFLNKGNQKNLFGSAVEEDLVKCGRTVYVDHAADLMKEND